MTDRGPSTARGRVRFRASCLKLFLLAGQAGCGALATDDPPTTPARPESGRVTGGIGLARGRELFLREWTPGDDPESGGDGLGPVYNDTSCVACHNAGGPGGAGPASKNVEILAAFQANNPDQKADPKAPPTPEFLALAQRHPGFRTASSVVLHLFGTDPTYRAWRSGLMREDGESEPATSGEAGTSRDPSDRARDEIQGLVERVRRRGSTGAGSFACGKITLLVSERNTPPLFGAGQIDSISEAVLTAESGREHDGFPEIKGRASRLAGGKIGRFGWKAQVADLEEFVLSACSIELGLEVPGHPQAVTPNAPAYRPSGLDLGEAECADLVAFIRDLPSPGALQAPTPREAGFRAEGDKTFGSIGCAACHSPRLGPVEGLFSDLLLHDMGPELGDSGSSYGSPPDPVEVASEDRVQPPVDLTKLTGDSPSGRPTPEKVVIGAKRVEWRTPPLWGFRDSGPYLHDGRAESLDEAVAMHGGEAEKTARRYFALPHRSRLQIETFLRSLTAPPALASTSP